MPLVCIEIIKGKSIEYKKEMQDAVHTALVNAIKTEDWDTRNGCLYSDK